VIRLWPIKDRGKYEIMQKLSVIPISPYAEKMKDLIHKSEELSNRGKLDFSS